MAIMPNAPVPDAAAAVPAGAGRGGVNGAVLGRVAVVAVGGLETSRYGTYVGDPGTGCVR